MIYLTADLLRSQYLSPHRAAAPGAFESALWENLIGDRDSNGPRHWSGSTLFVGDRALVVYASRGSSTDRALLGENLDLAMVESIVRRLNSDTGMVDLETLYKQLQALKD